MPFDGEHACRVQAPDEHDEFRRENGAATVNGRDVDHVYGVEGEVDVDLQSVRYPLANGWDTEEAMLDAQQHCEELGGLQFEPAEGFASARGCLSCGTDNHAMTDDHTKHKTVVPDGVVSREVDGQEQEVLRVPISSTRPDREGDRFSKEALEGMAEQIRREQPLVFQNHGLAGNFMEAIPYDQAETIGTHFDAEVEQAEDGEHELYAFVNPDGTHPEGDRMLKQVRDEGQAIKFSVGFGIKDAEPIEDDAGNEVGREFLTVDLMEDSKVGVPANPDASVTASAKNGLPGYAMHPMFRAMQGMEPDQSREADTYAEVAAKAGGTPEGGDDAAPIEDLRAEIDALRSEVAELRDGDDGDTKESCDMDDDCPDGKVCVDGECVDEDEMDDADPQETDDATPDAERVAELEDKLDDLRDSVRDGPGDSDTRDPTTDDAADLVNDTDDTAEDTTEKQTDDSDHERLL